MTAPYPLNLGNFNASLLPENENEAFLLPVCTTVNRYRKVLRALMYYQSRLPEADVEHIVDWLQALAYIENPQNAPCAPVPLPESSDCVIWQPNHPSIVYAPIDPHSQTGFAPPPYQTPPWRIATGATTLLPGLNAGDVFTDYLALAGAIGNNIFSILNNLDTGFPRFSFEVSGTGEIEIDFIGAPQGGWAYVLVNDDVIGADWVSLSTANVENVDTVQEILGSIIDLALEGGLYQVVKYERAITEPGNHTVTVYMLPEINLPEDIEDVANLIGFGGGIRQIELCGFSTMGEVPMPEIRLNGCNLEWRPNSEAAWLVLGDVCGNDGLPGAPAPVPQVRTVGINGGSVVEFDMNADNIYEASITVLDGADGTDGAPGAPGSDGAPGAPGADGQCPDCSDVDPPPKIPVPPEPAGGYLDADYCRIATYVSEQFTDVMNKTLDELVISGEFVTWYEEAAAKLATISPFNFVSSLAYYNAIVNYSSAEVATIKADIPALQNALKEHIYCNQSVGYFSVPAAILTVPGINQLSIDTAIAAANSVSVDQWNEWLNYAEFFTAPIDCSGINCSSGEIGDICTLLDFTVSDNGFTDRATFPDGFAAENSWSGNTRTAAGWQHVNSVQRPTWTGIAIQRQFPQQTFTGYTMIYESGNPTANYRNRVWYRSNGGAWQLDAEANRSISGNTVTCVRTSAPIVADEIIVEVFALSGVNTTLKSIDFVCQSE